VSSLLSGNLGIGEIKTVSSDGVFCGFCFVFFLPLRVDLVTQTLLLFFFFDFFFVVVGVILVGFLNSLAPLLLSLFKISAIVVGSGGSWFCVKEESCFCFLGGGSSSSPSSSMS
jgi:hypothetical protein